MAEKFRFSDSEVGITRDESGHILEIAPADWWWNAGVSENMAIYRINGKLYCADGRNGEEYIDSFEVSDRYTAMEGSKLRMIPIYRFEAESREPADENDEEKWEEDWEIVGFIVSDF